MTYAHAQSTSISIVYHCQFVGAKKDMYIIIILIIIKIIYTHMFIIIYVYPIWGQFWFSFCCSWPDNVTWLRPFMDTGADQLCHKTETWRWLASPARSTCRPYILHPKCKDANPVIRLYLSKTNHLQEIVSVKSSESKVNQEHHPFSITMLVSCYCSHWC